MASEEFDEQEVINLIAQALADGGASALQPERTLPLAFNDSRLLEVLATRLPKYVPVPDVQVILDELRDELYSDVNLGTLKQLHIIAKNCRRCPAMIPEPQMPQWNLVDPDVVFVLDQPTNHKESIDLFVSTLKKVGFSSSRIMLTYVNRCSMQSRQRPGAEEIKKCTPYLFAELQIVRPKLIMPLGLVPTAAILGTDVKLADERGHLCWLGPWAILPTVSPSYVLKGGGHIKENFEQDMQQAFNYLYGEK